MIYFTRSVLHLPQTVYQGVYEHIQCSHHEFCYKMWIRYLISQFYLSPNRYTNNKLRYMIYKSQFMSENRHQQQLGNPLAWKQIIECKRLATFVHNKVLKKFTHLMILPHTMLYSVSKLNIQEVVTPGEMLHTSRSLISLTYLYDHSQEFGDESDSGSFGWVVDPPPHGIQQTERRVTFTSERFTQNLVITQISFDPACFITVMYLKSYDLMYKVTYSKSDVGKL